MKRNSEKFKLKLAYAPFINVRNEFTAYYQQLDSKELREEVRSRSSDIRTPYFTWHSMPEAFLTVLLQRVILGIESYIPIATRFELMLLGKDNQEIRGYISNPYTLRGNGTVENVYHLLPSLADESYSLKTKRPGLWEENKDFYREVRNPIFHGMQIESYHLHHLRRSFEHIKKIYVWVDSWHPPGKMLDGIFKN